ncbi:MAG: acylphosphatase [Glaciimonas sp.]|nr:acylphosphatase [Glaciimonas sp.]
MAKNMHIAGLVQGVGYHAAFTTQARALKLSGWVRNRLDSSVEASVAGETQALKDIIAWAEHGPAGAQVLSVVVSEVDDGLVTDGEFRILPNK